MVVVTTQPDIAAAILTSSSALLGLSALILVTLRFSNYADIKQRLSRRDYNRLYDWTLLSFLAGAFSITFVLIYFYYFLPLLLTVAVIFMFIQMAELAFAVLRTFFPLKICRKGQFRIWWETIKYEKQNKGE